MRLRNSLPSTEQFLSRFTVSRKTIAQRVAFVTDEGAPLHLVVKTLTCSLLLIRTIAQCL
jgi:hypothetical protein